MTIVDRSAELYGGQCGMSELFGLPVRKSRPRRADLIGKRLDVRAGSDHFRVSLGGLLLGLFDRDKRHCGDGEIDLRWRRMRSILLEELDDAVRFRAARSRGPQSPG